MTPGDVSRAGIDLEPSAETIVCIGGCPQNAGRVILAASKVMFIGEELVCIGIDQNNTQFAWVQSRVGEKFHGSWESRRNAIKIKPGFERSEFGICQSQRSVEFRYC